MDIKSSIRTIPNWPKKGVMFRDITTLLKDPKSFKYVIDCFQERYQDKKIDLIVGIESRGFIIGAALADRLGIGFVPIRKKGKLPADTISESYKLEYGTDTIEIHKDAINPGMRVILVDDLWATGGTACAALKLIERLGGMVYECAFVIGLPDLKGDKMLAGYNIFTLVNFEGE